VYSKKALYESIFGSGCKIKMPGLWLGACARR